MAKIMKKGWKTGGRGKRQQLEINMNCQRETDECLNGGSIFSGQKVKIPSVVFNRPKFWHRMPVSFLRSPFLTRQLMNQLKTQSMPAYFKVK